MLRRNLTTFICCVALASGSPRVHGSDFVPIQSYQDPADSPFPEFGFRGTLVVEDFEREDLVPGLSISAKGNASIVQGFSVKSDTQEDRLGNAFEVTPTVCATTFPPSCPATVSIEFDENMLKELPTFFGFVWTDAVASKEALREPIALITVTNGQGEQSDVRRINELPLAESLLDSSADDTLISFMDDGGISKVDITVVTDGSGLGGHLAIDHIQFGIAAKPGDANVDGIVDFADFVILASSFGESGENVRWGQGDFNHDRTTSFPDFLDLVGNFGSQRTVASQPTPEPTSIFLGEIAVFAVLSCRRCRHA